MAVMDQDHFSNVSWHSEQSAGQMAGPSYQAHDEAGDRADDEGRGKSGGGNGVDGEQDAENIGRTGEILECSVTEPHKENDGTKDAYVSYLITTNTTFSKFQKPTTSVRRRFTDFVFLYKALCRDYQASAIPPLPDKQRMEYVRGDRFGPDFTARRAHSLQRFLSRIALHPELRKAPILHDFLESPDWNATMKARAARAAPNAAGGDGGLPSPTGNAPGNTAREPQGVFDAFTDSLINAFTKVHKPDRRFIDVKEKSDKLDEDLSHVEKVVARVVRREADLEADLKDLAEQFQKLITLEPGVQGPVHAFAASAEDSAAGLKRLREHTDADYLGSLRDMAAYSAALKDLIKAREQKQIDFEQLTESLHKSTADRDALAAGYGSGGGGGALGNAGGFIRSKLEDVRGVDHAQSRRERLRKLELRIAELTREVEFTREDGDKFAEQVVLEVKSFEWIKRIEFKRQLGGLADAHVDFYGGLQETWERYVREMEREGVVAPS